MRKYRGRKSPRPDQKASLRARSSPRSLDAAQGRPDWPKPVGVYTRQGRSRKDVARGRVPPIYIFRPAYIYPVEPRKEPNLSYRLLRAIYPAFRVLFPNQMIPADELGRAMVDVVVLGTVESEARILENRDIRAMVKS
jgi:hypothetical protein